MGKVCIFCGEHPVDKNKEHVIPQWLIQYTGDSKRLVFIDRNDDREIIIPWEKYVFPACKRCNSNFGNVEEKIKYILIKMNNEEPIKHGEFDLFLDWLDKIRIGIWLGQRMFGKSDRIPKFYINHRVAKKDRLCLIYRSMDARKGIQIIGTRTPIFDCVPSCFGLVINDLFILNYSKDFLVSKNLGFPYPDSYIYDKEGNILVNKMNRGNFKVTTPIIEGQILKPSIKLYQSILKLPTGFVKPVLGSNKKFIDTNCAQYHVNHIKSRIFISDDDNTNEGYWPKKSLYSFKFKTGIPSKLLFLFMLKMTLEHQIHSVKMPLIQFNISDSDDKDLYIEYLDGLANSNELILTDVKKAIAKIFSMLKSDILKK